MIVSFDVEANIGSMVRESAELFRYIPEPQAIDYEKTIYLPLGEEPVDVTVVLFYPFFLTSTIEFNNGIRDTKKEYFNCFFVNT